MKRKAAVTFFCCLMMAVGFISVAGADTVLFPVIVTNSPNVTTIISVTNQGPSTGFLRYVYAFKPATIGGAPNYGGPCSVESFVAPTFVPDIVSFDASGTFNGGFALFNDLDPYGINFDLGFSGPQRSYLLVTNSDSAGNRVNVGSTASLRGEAIILDIFAGAAWGYRAVNDTTREDFSFFSVLDGGGVVNVNRAGLAESSRFTFFPLNDWTTRFFVTPIGAGMDNIDRLSVVRLYNTSLLPGINGRGADIYSFNVPRTVVCTAAVSLTDLLDSTAFSNLFFTGGWGRFNIDSGDAALIYKLEFVFQNSTFGGTNNNGFLLSGVD
ncbi:MAG: hypothetical protein M1508_02835 [Nitrospirae bacterium]|nr:hypothetical protein [Nitrospirota bacterium]